MGYDSSSNFDMNFGQDSANMFHNFEPSLRHSNSDLDRIFDNSPFAAPGMFTPGATNPYGTWNTSGQEQNINFMHSNDGLSAYPFPNQMDPTLSTNFAACRRPITPANNSSSPPQNANNKRGSVAVPYIPEEPVTAAPVKKQRRSRKNKAPPSKAREEATRNKFLERNRVAASKCRQKKKEWTMRLDNERMKELAENERLKALYADVQAEVTWWKTKAMEHANCDHPDIKKWIEMEAARFAASPKQSFFPMNMSGCVAGSPLLGGSMNGTIDQSGSMNGSMNGGMQGMASESMNDGAGYEGSRSNSVEPKQFRNASFSRPERMSFFQQPNMTSDPASASSSAGPSSRDVSEEAFGRQGGKSHRYGDSGVSDMGTPKLKDAKQETDEDEGDEGIDVPNYQDFTCKNENAILGADDENSLFSVLVAFAD